MCVFEYTYHFIGESGELKLKEYTLCEVYWCKFYKYVYFASAAAAAVATVALTDWLTNYAGGSCLFYNNIVDIDWYVWHSNDANFQIIYTLLSVVVDESNLVYQ